MRMLPSTMHILPRKCHKDGSPKPDYTEMQPLSKEENDRSSPKKPFRSKLNDHWILEIVSCIGSLGALLAIVGVLRVYDRKPIPEWPWGITVNAVLSWLSQIFNALMLSVIASCLSQSKWVSFSRSHLPLAEMNTYDSASRGIIGCIVFLWSLKHIRQYTSVGAIVTIIAVGVGPFVQQMATIENSLVLSDVPASVARAQTYMSTTPLSYIVPPSGMLAAVYGTVFSCSNANCSTNNNRSYPTVKPSCPTGECNISQFTTLALCAECADISYLLSWNRTTTTPGCEGFSVDHYLLPNGFNASMPSPTPTDHEFYRKTDTGPNSKRLRPIAGLTNYGNSSLLDFTTIEFLAGRDTSRGVAEQCTLFWCIKTLSSGMKNHNPREETLSTYVDPRANLSTGWLELQSTNASIPPFRVSLWDHNNIKTWLQRKLTLDVIGVPSCTSDSGETGPAPPPPGSEFLGILFDSPLDKIFSSLASGVTTYLRQSSTDTEMFIAHYNKIHENDDEWLQPDKLMGPANGTSWQTVTQIRVRWQWITLPACMMLAAVSFLVVTALQTKESGVDVWKSSNIPIFCSGLDTDVQLKLRQAQDPVRMDDLSQEVSAKLVRDENKKWQLNAQ